MINEQIRDREVRVIGQDGEQLGIMSASEAMKLAREAELDLVKIAPTAKPPVCKIIDYGKYRYEMARKEKEAKKKQKTIEIKEVRLSPNIDDNDLNTKVNAAKKFIQKGDKVKVTLRFRGREMAHTDIGKDILRKFAEGCGEVGNMDKDPKLEGRNMSMFISPKSQAQIQKAAKEKKKQQEEAERAARAEAAKAEEAEAPAAEEASSEE